MGRCALALLSVLPVLALLASPSSAAVPAKDPPADAAVTEAAGPPGSPAPAHPIPMQVVELGPSSTTAAVCSLFFPGAGHFYVGGEATSRGVSLVFAELGALGVAIYGLTSDNKYSNGTGANAPFLGGIAVVGFLGLRAFELVDAGRSADRARTALVQGRPAPEPHLAFGVMDRASSPLVTFRLASF